jgi:hypothetical protein
MAASMGKRNMSAKHQRNQPTARTARPTTGRQLRKFRNLKIQTKIRADTASGAAVRRGRKNGGSFRGIGGPAIFVFFLC